MYRMKEKTLTDLIFECVMKHDMEPDDEINNILTEYSNPVLVTEIEKLIPIF